MSSLELDLVGQNEIAERIGVKLGTIHQWRQRYSDFPEPLVVLKVGPVWEWSSIDEWIGDELRRRLGASRLPLEGKALEAERRAEANLNETLR